MRIQEAAFGNRHQRRQWCDVHRGCRIVHAEFARWSGAQLRASNARPAIVGIYEKSMTPQVLDS
jgi:hypothetical protein